MKPPNPLQSGHSADVRIQLHLSDRVLPIAQLGPDFFVLRTPIDHPPSEAELALSIDGRERRWRVRLAEGIQSGQRKTFMSRCGNGNGSTVR